MIREKSKYELLKTEEIACLVDPDVDSLICGAIALLELAFCNAPCSGPESDLITAIGACKKALLFDYENFQAREDMK